MPFLISKEFPSNEENDPFVSKSSQEESSVVSLADIHQARWTKLFDQMDKALAEEEKQLVSIVLDIVLFDCTVVFTCIKIHVSAWRFQTIFPWTINPINRPIMLFTINSTFELQESWLNQVKEMQIHCDQGLSHAQSNAAFGSQQLGENDLRLVSLNLISSHMPL